MCGFLAASGRTGSAHAGTGCPCAKKQACNDCCSVEHGTANYSSSSGCLRPPSPPSPSRPRRRVLSLDNLAALRRRQALRTSLQEGRLRQRGVPARPRQEVVSRDTEGGQQRVGQLLGVPGGGHDPRTRCRPVSTVTEGTWLRPFSNQLMGGRKRRGRAEAGGGVEHASLRRALQWISQVETTCDGMRDSAFIPNQEHSDARRKALSQAPTGTTPPLPPPALLPALTPALVPALVPALAPALASALAWSKHRVQVHWRLRRLPLELCYRRLASRVALRQRQPERET